MKRIIAKDEVRLLWPFYLERFISHVLYFAPAFWIIFLNDSLSLGEIGLLFSILSITMFIFEIPTGAFADIFGRKVSTIFAYLGNGITMFLFIFADNIYFYCMLFIMWGFFGTFYSGAREAWVVDYLKYYKKDHFVENYFLKIHSLTYLGLFFSGLLGAIIVSKFGIVSIWIFAGLSWMVSLLLLLPIREHKISRGQTLTFLSLYKQSKESIKYSISHFTILFFLISSFFIMFRDAFIQDIIWQPFLTGMGFPIFALGILFSFTTIMGSLTPFISKPLLKRFKDEKGYLIFLMICGMIMNFLAFYIEGYIFGILIMISILFLINLAMPIGESYFQKFIPSKKRATISSFKNMVISLAYAISTPIAGFLSDNIGFKSVIMIGGLFLIPAIYFFWKIDSKGKK